MRHSDLEYKKWIDQTILKLHEAGTLQKLKTKWWKQKRGGGACAEKATSTSVKPLGLDNVAGVFLVTIGGCFMACFMALLEFLYGTRQSAKEAGLNWLQEMLNEMKFILKCHGNVKEVCDT